MVGRQPPNLAVGVRFLSLVYMKRKILSITKSDCDWQTFRAGGSGGQNQNKVESGVRCVHRASGARGEARDSRDQLRNRRAAFRRMAESDIFKTWLKLETSRLVSGKSIEEIVDEQIQDQYLKVEIF